MPANNKIITLDNLTEYDTKIKEYILNSALRELTEDTNIWELSQGIYRAAPGIKLYYNTNSGCITVGAYGDLLSVALSNNGSTPFYLMGRSVQGNETINTIVVGVAQNNLYGVCDVYDMAEMRSVVHIYNNQTIYGKKTFSTLPESTVVPTTDKQLVNKKYVDDSILDNAIYLGKVTDYNTQEKALNFDNLKEGVYYITFDSSTLYCKLTNSQGVVTTKSFAFPGIDYKLSLIIYLVVPADIIPEETQANSLIATFQYLRHGTSYISGESDYALVNQKFIARTDSSNYLAIVESKGAREYVSATYTQTISGKKTFNTLPESTVVPTTNNQLVNKKYVDDKTSTKQDTLVSGTNIKTINNESLLGSGDITISGGGDTIYIGTSADHDTEAKALDITGLDEGIYMMTVTSESGFVELWLKATRPTGLTTCRLSIHRNLQPIMNNVCYLHITKKVDNDLANGTIFGYFTCFALVGGTYLYKLKLSLLFSTTNYAMIYSDNSTYQGCMTTSSVDTITAKKTFNVLPESSVAPTTDNQLVNKKYVDDNIPSIEPCTNNDIDSLFTDGGEE